jgi:hypothetical protein
MEVSIAEKWIAFVFVAYAFHTVAAVIAAKSKGVYATRTILEWPFLSIRTKLPPSAWLERPADAALFEQQRLTLDVAYSLITTVVEIAFTAWAFVNINDLLAARFTGLLFMALTAIAVVLAAVPALLLSWLLAGLVVLVLPTKF